MGRYDSVLTVGSMECFITTGLLLEIGYALVLRGFQIYAKARECGISHAHQSRGHASSLYELKEWTGKLYIL